MSGLWRPAVFGRLRSGGGTATRQLVQRVRTPLRQPALVPHPARRGLCSKSSTAPSSSSTGTAGRAWTMARLRERLLQAARDAPFQAFFGTLATLVGAGVGVYELCTHSVQFAV